MSKKIVGLIVVLFVAAFGVLVFLGCLANKQHDIPAETTMVEEIEEVVEEEVTGNVVE